jgi:polyphosphate kinase 2 (PPK2 family)
MNPQGTSVFGFKHRANTRPPMTSSGVPTCGFRGKGEVVVFGRSYYEDILVMRVHRLARTAIGMVKTL